MKLDALVKAFTLLDNTKAPFLVKVYIIHKKYLIRELFEKSRNAERFHFLVLRILFDNYYLFNCESIVNIIKLIELNELNVFRNVKYFVRITNKIDNSNLLQMNTTQFLQYSTIL